MSTKYTQFQYKSIFEVPSQAALAKFTPPAGEVYLCTVEGESVLYWRYPDGTTVAEASGATATSSANTYVTSGTYASGTSILTLTRNDGATIEVSGITAGASSDVYLTGGTYASATTTLTLTDNAGNSFSVSGFSIASTDDIYLTGGTYSAQESTMKFDLSDGSQTSITGVTDTVITSGTYSDVSQTLTLRDDEGGSLNITGFSQDTNISAVSFDTTTLTLSGAQGVISANNVTGHYVSGASYDNRALSLSGSQGVFAIPNVDGHYLSGASIDLDQNLMLSGSQGVYNVSLSGIDTNVSAGTAVYSGTAAGIISMEGTQGTFDITNVRDTYVSGGSFSAETLMLDQTDGNTIEISGITSSSVTGATVSGDTITFTKDQGAPAFDLTGLTSDNSASGYFDIANMRIQWGTAFATGAAVSFPQPFADTNYGMSLIIDAGGPSDRITSVGSKLASSFTLFTFNSGINAVSNIGETVYWTAIGTKP